MSAPLLNNAQQNRMHSVVSNQCGDRSPDRRFGAWTGAPDPRFGAGTGVGSPIPPGIPSAHNHFTINITNHPGATVDVGKLHDIASAVSHPAPGLLPAPTTLHIQRTNLRPDDLRRSLLSRTATSAVRPAPDDRSALAPPTASLPATKNAGKSGSYKRRMRTERRLAARHAQPVNPGLPAADSSDQMSALILEVASLRKAVHANRQPSPAPADPRPRAPSSPPGPAPELFENARLRLSTEHRYYPLCAGTTAARLPSPSNARPLGLERSFQPLRDSDHLLRRRPSRSRSPRCSPEPPTHRRRLEWSTTPTPSVINGFLSPFRKGAAGPTRPRSPPRGSRPSPRVWTPRDRDLKRPRCDSPTRPAPPSNRVWRPSSASTLPGCNKNRAETTPHTEDAATPPAPSPPSTPADSARDSVRETLAAVVRAKETQWKGIHTNLTESLLQRFSKTSQPLSTSAAYLSKIDALRTTVVNTLASWKSSRHELAGSLLDAFGEDDSPSLDRLDDLTTSLEVAFDEATTRTGSPFTSADEDSASSPSDASAGPLPDSAPLVPASPGPEPASPLPAVFTDPPATSPLESLLGRASYVSGNEEFEEIHPTTAPAPLRAASLPRTERAPRPPRQFPKTATAATATPAPATATAHTRIRQPERLKLRRNPTSLGRQPRASHYPQLALVSTTATTLSSLDRLPGRDSDRGFTPSPPRPPPITPRAEPAPPAAPRPRITWLTRHP
jgi:hypothetical protein